MERILRNITIGLSLANLLLCSSPHKFYFLVSPSSVSASVSPFPSLLMTITQPLSKDLPSFNVLPLESSLPLAARIIFNTIVFLKSFQWLPLPGEGNLVSSAKEQLLFLHWQPSHLLSKLHPQAVMGWVGGFGGKASGATGFRVGVSWAGQWGGVCAWQSSLGSTGLRGERTVQPETRTTTRYRENRRMRAMQGQSRKEGGAGRSWVEKRLLQGLRQGGDWRWAGLCWALLRADSDGGDQADIPAPTCSCFPPLSLWSSPPMA